MPTWNTMSPNKNLVYIQLKYDNPEYIKIKELFLRTTRRNFITSIVIHRIQNPYLMCRFLLKKLEMRRIYQKEPTERYLFNGRKFTYVESFCRENFDWRKYGDNKGYCFGQGVYFSRISHYASHYCDKGNVPKVILVAAVPVCNDCIGSSDMPLPPFFGSPQNASLRDHL